MKRKLRFLAGACLFTATALFSGCSSDDDFLMDPVDSGTSQTRAVTNSDGLSLSTISIPACWQALPRPEKIFIRTKGILK